MIIRNCCNSGIYVPLTEIRQQIDYARTVSKDICKTYSKRTPNITELLGDYNSVKTKLSMLEDFLFQAALWCDTILSDEATENNNEIIKEEE